MAEQATPIKPEPTAPRRALILAAGLGERLRPLTQRIPKPLVPIWGEPLIDHAIAMLRDWGVREFAINTHWRAEALREHLRRRWPNESIRISHEPLLLGTGGALLPLRDFIESEERFWIFNSDVLASLDPTELLRANTRSGALATLWLTEKTGPRSVLTDATGAVTTFRHKHRPALVGERRGATFTGLHLVSGRIYQYLDSAAPSSIITAYERAQSAGELVEGCTLADEYWSDCGTPAALLDAHGRVRQNYFASRPGGHFYRAHLDRAAGSCVDPAGQCADSATLERSIVCAGARVGGSARLRRCIVAPGAVARHDCSHAVLAAPEDFDDARIAAVMERLGFSGGDVSVAALSPRGSDRAFFRLSAEGGSAMLILYGTERAENARYVPLTAALNEAGVPVPRILAHDAQARWIALQDLGLEDLQTRLLSLPAGDWQETYGRVLETVARLHGGAGSALGKVETEPAFGAVLYQWERELFARHLLRDGLGMSEAEIESVVKELEAFTAPLLRVRHVMMHRDLQSSNIFMRGETAYLIDFQGMRPGPAAYDLASLLCDPYARLPRDLRHTLLERCAAQAPWGREVAETFRVAAVQRLTQALGAYGRLSAIAGMQDFVRHIPVAARIFLEETQGAKGLGGTREVMARLSLLPQEGEVDSAFS